MKYILILLFAFTNAAYGYETSIEFDSSQCGKKDCSALFVKNLVVNKDLEVLFWADVVDPFHKGYPRFYPLFNIFNRTQSVMKLHFEVELQDIHHSSLGSSSLETEIIPHSKIKTQYDIYRSINAIDLDNGTHEKAKFVRLRVMYQ